MSAPPSRSPWIPFLGALALLGVLWARHALIVRSAAIEAAALRTASAPPSSGPWSRAIMVEGEIEAVRGYSGDALLVVVRTSPRDTVRIWVPPDLGPLDFRPAGGQQVRALCAARGRGLLEPLSRHAFCLVDDPPVHVVPLAQAVERPDNARVWVKAVAGRVRETGSGDLRFDLADDSGAARAVLRHASRRAELERLLQGGTPVLVRATLHRPRAGAYLVVHVVSAP